jgi:iron(III) transport system substrate-binding protein
MKKVYSILAIVIAISMLAACTKAPATEETTESESGYSGAKDEWLRTNQLGVYDTGKQDWAAIEAAAKAEGALLVYANSSKTEKAALAFEELYPEIDVQAFDLGGDDVLLKTQEEQKAEAFVGDVWFSSGGPTIKGELVPKGYVWKFVPDTVVDKIPAELQDPLLTSRLGVTAWAYNSELNDSCPISNIWELTEPEWNKKIFIEDPLNDASTLGKLMTFVSHPDEMAAAYKAYYGEDPVLDDDTADAGWLWLKRLAQNGPIPQPGGDEVDSAFATPGMTESFLALGSYGNYPDVLEGNLTFDLCWDLEPVGAIGTQSYIGILNQSTHPNAAKLWIKYIMTQEGIDPWYKIGTYMPNPEMPAPEGAIPYSEISEMSWMFNDAFVYDNIVKARDFYLVNLGK